MKVTRECSRDLVPPPLVVLVEAHINLHQCGSAWTNKIYQPLRTPKGQQKIALRLEQTLNTGDHQFAYFLLSLDWQSQSSCSTPTSGLLPLLGLIAWFTSALVGATYTTTP